jgi:small subunit ribosomal protein S21
MLVISVKEGESIDRALKRYKRKYDRTGVMKQLRARKQFIKPSVNRRKEVIKAAYIQQKRQDEEYFKILFEGLKYVHRVYF